MNMRHQGVRTIFDRIRCAEFEGQKNSSGPVDGFSLLEVILALAILAGALAALGEVMRLGDQNAALAADESQAGLLAASVMSEVLVGARPLANVRDTVLPFDDDPQWAMSIEIQPTDYQELVAVRVSVMQQLAPELQPARCDLVRWLPNPDYLPTIASQPQQAGSGAGTGTGADASSGQGLGGGQL